MNRPRAPDMDKKTGVYQLKHVESGKVYIGSAVCLWRRKKDHTTRLNCGRHGNEYLQRAWTKYGSDAFGWTVLEYCGKEERLQREQHWIDALDATNEAKGFNLIPTRGSQLYGAAVTKLQLKRWSRHGKEQRQELCSHLFDPEHRAKAQALATQAKRTPEYRAKRSAIARRHLTTPEHRARNAARLKAMWQDPEFRAARLAGLTVGRNKTNAKRRKSP